MEDVKWHNISAYVYHLGSRGQHEEESSKLCQKYYFFFYAVNLHN